MTLDVSSCFQGDPNQMWIEDNLLLSWGALGVNWLLGSSVESETNENGLATWVHQLLEFNHIPETFIPRKIQVNWMFPAITNSFWTNSPSVSCLPLFDSRNGWASLKQWNFVSFFSLSFFVLICWATRLTRPWLFVSIGVSHFILLSFLFSFNSVTLEEFLVGHHGNQPNSQGLRLWQLKWFWSLIQA